jgi:hypothetical protein
MYPKYPAQAAAELNPGVSDTMPSTYGYGPRPGDPLCQRDTPSLNGELSLSERELDRLQDTVAELEMALGDLLGPDSPEALATPTIVPPPLPPALEQIRVQRHRMRNLTDRLLALRSRVAM